MTRSSACDEVLRRIDVIRDGVGERFRDEMVAASFQAAETVARDVVRVDARATTWDERLDLLLTHPVWGWPLMIAVLSGVFWVTVVGANVPSGFLAGILIEDGGLGEWCQQYIGIAAPALLSRSLYEILLSGLALLHAPAWLTGILVDGVYLCVAWVVSVMLPPMAIFFPIFTFLEDLGYLPRVAFNLDPLFRRVGAHGKQALTMSMGFGCNAAGVVACRIIESPREKLIAIITNNFMICNGRFPTVIAVSTLMIAAGISSPWLMSAAAAVSVVAVVFLGILVMLATSWALSRTVLKGEASAFTLELPPYRRPMLTRILYTSLVDRTIFVLGRACVVAAPAGLVIWLVANVHIGDAALGQHLIRVLDPYGHALGLSGIILLAYVIAIPANEIVVPTIIMLLVLVSGDQGLGLAAGRMVEPGGEALQTMLRTHGWTLMTSVCLLLFVLLHNPCGTTIWTIWKETRSWKWTLLAVALPLTMGFGVCALTAAIWRMVA